MITRIVMLATGVVISASAASAASPTARTQPVLSAGVSHQAQEPRVMFLVDLSGSMNMPLPTGGTRIQVAQQALATAVSDPNSEGEMGLRTFGQRDNMFCGSNDSDLVVSPGAPSARNNIQALAKTLRANGAMTQLGHSLQTVVDHDLEPNSNRLQKVVLVTDGDDTCMSMQEVCEVAKEAKKKIKNLQIDVIAYSIQNSEVRKGLRCLTNHTDGNFFEAYDGDQLRDSLKTTVRRVEGLVVGQGVRASSTEEEKSKNTNDHVSW